MLLSSETGKGETIRKVRVTYVIPYELDRNVEALSLREGRLKTDVVTAALRQYLTGKGLQPEKAPKVSVSY